MGENTNLNIDADITKLLQQFYRDFWQKSIKNIWKALWDITEIFPMITWQIKSLLNNKTFKKNIKNYWDKIEDIDEENRIKVPKELSVPLLIKFTYYDNKYISNMFSELLAKASDKNKISHVLPKYIYIVENLSEDEAIILKYIYDNHLERIPLINFHVGIKWNSTFVVFLEYFTVLNDLNTIQISNINIYIENLINLWLFKPLDMTYIWWIESDKIYGDLEKKLRSSPSFDENLQNFKEGISIKSWDAINDYIDVIDKHKLELTSLWKDFLNTVFSAEN